MFPPFQFGIDVARTVAWTQLPPWLMKAPFSAKVLMAEAFRRRGLGCWFVQELKRAAHKLGAVPRAHMLTSVIGKESRAL